MQKQGPTLGRIAAMVIFSLSVFGLLTFLWIAFGGPVPLKPKPYEVKVNFPEATTLAQQADVRIAGVSVGKVQQMELDKGAARETATLNIDPKFAPLPSDTRAILRQKTLLGETYVELTPGDPRTGHLHDGVTLSNTQVEPTVTLDEILRVFDPKTRQAFRAWLAYGAQQFRGNTPVDLNDALGNLAGFAQSGASVLSVLNAQSGALRDVVHNTGVVFGALNQRQGQLRGLIVNSFDTFQALSSEQAALADTFRVFPTFLDESRTTLARLQRFSVNTRPLVDALKPVADRLAPTFRDFGALSPDLKRLFKNLRPVIRVAPRDIPQGARFLRGTPALFKGFVTFLPEFNPILSDLNYNQEIVGGFLHDGEYGTNYHHIPTSSSGDGEPHSFLGFAGAIVDKSFSFNDVVPNWDRGDAYDLPNYYPRAVPLGISESFTCRHTSSGGEERVINANPPTSDGEPPCFAAPAQLYNDTKYTFLARGDIYLRPPPRGLQGNGPTPNYNRPLGPGQ